jgi:hypothetical protein
MPPAKRVPIPTTQLNTSPNTHHVLVKTLSSFFWAAISYRLPAPSLAPEEKEKR